mmetsp:Transcript_16539/g.46175  ORF Transcript_16539/g.46175 Transcript_16539/m.46175 type:complete len:713 (+) Transcript_16539:229-2367(+)|eukprot:CAMPEP_0117686162 /NCGR_PEP_ID=MMETSP0804-20121206/22256_1 /TAXON_ID=1074897 /ORGANISM="Tetraselmis astigmatica, Strain CCMP880" /LENGTH=712 /DNA_ID=CAMNT_0005497743 /DNA_START=151 /DNA_END=2289 /DNA_ORIENTATION=+
MGRRKPRPGQPAQECGFGLWAAPLLGILLILPACSYTFAGDDHDCIGWNEDTDSFTNTTWLGAFLHDTMGENLSNNLSCKEYRPLSVLTWRLEHYLSGGHNPHVFHGTNVFLHGLAALLFHLVLTSIMKVPEPVASASSVMFAAHPTHVHAATNVAGLPEILLAIFQFSGMLVWNCAMELRMIGQESIRMWWLLLLFLLLVAVGTLTHELCCLTVPLCFFGQLFLAETRGPSHLSYEDDGDGTATSQRRRQQAGGGADAAVWVWHGLSFAALAAGMAARGRLVGPQSADAQPGFVDNQFLTLAGLPRVLSVLNILALELWYLIFPFNVSTDYSYSSLPVVESCTNPTGMVATALPLLIAWVAASFWRSSDRRLVFGLAWLLLHMAPLSGAFYNLRFALKPRTLFIPSAAICAIASVLISRMKWGDSGTKKYTILALAAVFAATIVTQNQIYESHFMYWRTIRGFNTMNAKAHYKLANILAQGTNLAEEPVIRAQVMELYVSALQIYPAYDIVYVERGKLYLELGEEVQAEDDFQFASDLHNPEAHFQLGLLYMTKAGKEACMNSEWHFLQALAKDPTDYRSYTNMGICRYWVNDLVNATRWLEKALDLAPPEDLGVPADAMANILRMNKDYDKALFHHRQAVEQNPNHLAFRANLAYTLYEVGRYLEAAAEYDEVAAQHPEHYDAYKANADLSRQMLMTTINLGNEKPIHPP